MKLLRRPGVLFLPLALVAAALSVLFVNRAIHEYSLPIISDAGGFYTKQFARDISANGATKAYQDFGHAVSSLSSGQQHFYAHQFGAALYETKGLAGVSTCDDKFSYGCYHAFLASAIAEHGIDVLASLFNGCAKNIGAAPCEHGFGHGLVSYYGWDEAGLKQALGACNAYTRSDILQGCRGGVYMEYNMHTVYAAEGMGGPRPYTGDLYAPCSSLDAAERPVCYFWLSQWWYDVAFRQSHSGDDRFMQAAAACPRTPSDASDDCYAGLGYVISTENRSLANGECSSLTDAHGSFVCKMAAAWNLAGYGFATSSRMCAGLYGDHLAQCDSQAATNTPLF